MTKPSQARGPSKLYELTEEEQTALRLAATDEVDKVIVGQTVFCGLRAGEVVHMRLEWITSDHSISIPPEQPCQCKDCGGKWSPKTESSVRVVPIPSWLYTTIEGYYGHNPQGLSFTRQHVWRRVKAVVRKTGIRHRVFPHSLRSTYATTLAANGMEAAGLCYLLGWSDLETAQHYVQLARSKKMAAQKAREIMG